MTAWTVEAAIKAADILAHMGYTFAAGKWLAVGGTQGPINQLIAAVLQDGGSTTLREGTLRAIDTACAEARNLHVSVRTLREQVDHYKAKLAELGWSLIEDEATGEFVWLSPTELPVTMHEDANFLQVTDAHTKGPVHIRKSDIAFVYERLDGGSLIRAVGGNGLSVCESSAWILERLQ